MAFADPIILDGGGTANTLARTGLSLNEGTFGTSILEGLGTYTLTMSHAYGKRTRRVFRLDTGVVKDDVFSDTTNSLFSDSVYLVVDQPKYGIGPDELARRVQDMMVFLSGVDPAESSLTWENLTKFLNGEG